MGVLASRVTIVLTVFFAVALAAQNRPPQQQTQQQPQQQLPPGTASISGIVVAMGTNEPVPLASVELRRLDCNSFANPPEVLTASTGADGRFVFRNIHAGGWCIVATMAGGKYTPGEYMQRGVLGRGVTIPVIDGQNVSGIQLAMAPTGGISGRVRDRDGEPIGFARVQVMEVFYQDGQRRLYTLQVAQTDDRGEYRFYWLPPGQYYIAVVREDTRRRQVVSVQPPPGTGGHREDTAPAVVTPRIQPDGKLIEETYLTVYYPGETDPERASPVVVAPGGAAGGMDISLNAGTVRSYHVRGAALNGLTGEPAANAQVRVAPCEWSATIVMPGAQADPAGRFDIAGVTPGCHVLYANMTMANPAAPPPGTAPAQPAAGPPPPPIQLTARLPLEVGGANLDNLRMVLTQGTNIAGRIIFEGAAPDGIPRGISVSLAREPDLVGVLATQARGAVQPDGTFSLQGVGAGDYRIYVAPFIVPFSWSTPAVPQQLQNMYVKSIRAGGTDVISDGMRVEGGGPGDLQIVLGPGGRLQGQTSDDKRQPLPNATIALVPDLALRRRPELYRTTTSDISGRFKLDGIPPGTYKAFAWEVVAKDIWQNPDFIRNIEGRGVTVEIREGSVANAEIMTIQQQR